MSTRREMLQALAASLGAGAVVPGLTAGHPLGRHAGDAELLCQADARAQSVAYTPQFLDPHHFETLVSLAELIVPGATRARVSEFIDQLLAVDAPDDQRAFLNALGAFDGESLARARKPWKQLAEADQIAILTEASTVASGRSADGTAAEPALTLRDHFDLLKGWVAGAYYSSEIGMRELGWTGNAFYREFPGCDHPEGHA